MDETSVANATSAPRILLCANRLVLSAWKPVLIYGGAVQLIVGLLLAPIALWALTAALGFLRSGAVMNYEIADLVTSLDGLAMGILSALLLCTLAVLAVGGHVLIIAAAHLGKRITWRGIAGTLLGSLHRLPGLGILKFTGLAFAAIPLIGMAATAIAAVLLAPFGAAPAERLLPKEIADLAFAGPLLAAIAGLAFILHVRWFFTFQALVIERLSLTRAMGRSVELVRGSFRPVAKAVALHHLWGAIVLGVLGLLLGLLDSLVLGLASPERGTGYLYLLAVLLVLNSAVLGAAGVFLVARLVAIGTLFYFRLGGEAELERFETEPPVGRSGGRSRWIGVCAATVILLLLATLITVPKIEKELAEMGRRVQVTAHRGASGEAPENTLASVRLAIENGADYAEIDFQEAGDGAVILFHDANVKRVTGVDRHTYEMTLSELKELDVGSHFDPAFKDERIPTLDEVLDLAKGRIRLNLELKPHGHEKNFARSVVDSIRRAAFEQDLVITSNDYPILQEIRSLAPDLRIGMLVAAALGDLSGLDVDFYSVQPMYATVSFIRRAHADGRDVHVWTVNEKAAMTRLIDRGVDNLITDYPLKAIGARESRTEFDEFKAAIGRLFRK